MTAVGVLQVMGASLTIAGGWPQTWRSVRGSVAGVSGATWAALAGSGVLWALWGVAADVMLVAWSEGVLAVAAAIVAWRCLGVVRSLLTSAAVFAVCVALGFMWGEWGFGVAGVVVVVVCRVPQMWVAWTSGDVSGVSSLAWWCLIAANVAWAAAGVLTRDVILTVGGVVTVVSSMVIVAGTVVPRRMMPVDVPTL